MTRESGREPRQWIGVLLIVGVLAGLAACAPVDDPSAGMPVADAVALIEKAPRSEINLADLAEAFAFGTRSTDVQRENLQAELVGRRVEWDIPVFEVSHSEGRYEVTSQPIPIQDPEAAALIRVVAIVVPRNEADDELLRTVKTNDVIRVRGIVQEIRLRTIVAIVPATIISSTVSVDR